MSVFDEIGNIFKDLFGLQGDNWVKRHNGSPQNLETCNGVAEEDGIYNTCALCVALNDTIFKNNNKPNFYHIRCKCGNHICDMSNVILKFDKRKITEYLFVDKNKFEMMKSMGYELKDAEEIYYIIEKNVKSEFLGGNYKLKELNINGQHFQINFRLYGKNNHIGELFNCHVGCVAWPNGKILIATPLIKD